MKQKILLLVTWRMFDELWDKAQSRDAVKPQQT